MHYINFSLTADLIPSQMSLLGKTSLRPHSLNLFFDGLSKETKFVLHYFCMCLCVVPIPVTDDVCHRNACQSGMHHVLSLIPVEYSNLHFSFPRTLL